MTEEKGNTIQTVYEGIHTLEFMSKDTLLKLYELAGRFPLTNVSGTFKVTIEFYLDDEVEDE